MQEVKSKLLQDVQVVRRKIYADVREQLADEGRTYQQIADSVGCSLATVQRLAQTEHISRPVGPRPKSSAMGVSDGKK